MQHGLQVEPDSPDLSSCPVWCCSTPQPEKNHLETGTKGQFLVCTVIPRSPWRFSSIKLLHSYIKLNQTDIKLTFHLRQSTIIDYLQQISDYSGLQEWCRPVYSGAHQLSSAAPMMTKPKVRCTKTCSCNTKASQITSCKRYELAIAGLSGLILSNVDLGTGNQVRNIEDTLEQSRNIAGVPPAFNKYRESASGTLLHSTIRPQRRSIFIRAAWQKFGKPDDQAWLDMQQAPPSHLLLELQVEPANMWKLIQAQGQPQPVSVCVRTTHTRYYKQGWKASVMIMICKHSSPSSKAHAKPTLSTILGRMSSLMTIWFDLILCNFAVAKQMLMPCCYYRTSDSLWSGQVALTSLALSFGFGTWLVWQDEHL